MAVLIHKDLSYKIVGILFDVHKSLGNRYQEKYYQRAIEEGLMQNKLRFEKELSVDLRYKGKKIGKYFLDFLIEKKIVLEIKAVPELKAMDFRQVLGYLKANKLELGILANFRPGSLEYKRILNSDLIRSKN